MKRNTEQESKPFWELGLNPITMKKEEPLMISKNNIYDKSKKKEIGFLDGNTYQPLDELFETFAEIFKPKK